MSSGTPLHRRNALRVVTQITPILESHGLYDVEYERPTYGLHQKQLPGTLVWRAVRRWKTRKTAVWKSTWYVIVHYPREDVYSHMTDEEYGLEVVRQLDDMLYSEVFASTNLVREIKDKRRFLKKTRKQAASASVPAPAPAPPSTEDWDSF